MRSFTTVVAIAGILGPAAAAAAQDKGNALDRQVSEALRDMHDRGAELYNAGDKAGGYRMYQGGLVVARGLLGHRPELQKLITDGLAEAERLTSTDRRAFQLHELIERVRVDLRGRKTAAPVGPPPREVKPGAKTELKPAAAVGEAKDGVVGRVLWQGKPVAGVEVMFVTLDLREPRVFETLTGAQGVYTVPDLKPGRYVVLITPGPNAEVKKLPERYATSTTSPLRMDVKGGGEKLDFVLQ